MLLLLERERGLKVVREEGVIPDILLLAPTSVEAVRDLRHRFPTAWFVAVVDWHRQERFAGSPIDEYVDILAGYDTLLEKIRSRGQGPFSTEPQAKCQGI